MTAKGKPETRFQRRLLADGHTSTVVTVPKAFVKELGLKLGEDVEWIWPSTRPKWMRLTVPSKSHPSGTGQSK